MCHSLSVRKIFLVGAVFLFLFLVPKNIYADQPCTSNVNCPGNQICVDPDNNPNTNNSTCQSAGPGLQNCADYWNSKGGCDGTHITPGTNNTITCKWEYVQSSCYSAWGPDVYGICSGHASSAKNCLNNTGNACNWDPNTQHTTGRCVDNTPPPAPLQCSSISVSGGTGVSPGSRKSLGVTFSGGSAPYSYKWTQSTTGKVGVFSSTSSVPVFWTAPSSLVASQNWQIKVQINDALNKTTACSVNLNYFAKTHKECRQQACKSVAGAGSDLCSDSSQCRVVTHLGCVANACQVVSGPGTDECPSAGSVCSTNPSIGFFETFGGKLTAKSILADANLPAGKALSQFTSTLDAAIVVGAPIDLPSGVRYSDNGGNGGLHLNNYADASPIPTYEEFLSRALLAGRLNQVSDLASCPSGGTDDNIHHIRFWCYGSTKNLNDEMHAALSTSYGSEINYHVFVPDPNFGTGPRTISLKDKVNKTLLVFVDAQSPGGLTITDDVTIDPAAPTGALAAIVNGSLSVDGSVKQLDGLYVFSGSFDDHNTDTQIAGVGSLIGPDISAFASPHGLVRKYNATPQAAEKWTFDSRYLALYGNLLARPHNSWKELTPE